jgi:hypothetical protein
MCCFLEIFGMLLEHMFMFLVQIFYIFYILFAICFNFFIKTGAYELGSRKTMFFFYGK